MALIYEDKTEILRRCFFDVQNEVGLGRQEEDYHSPLNCLVIEYCILLTFTALFDNNQFNVNRGKSYLKALDLNWGIAANFGNQSRIDGTLLPHSAPNIRRMTKNNIRGSALPSVGP